MGALERMGWRWIDGKMFLRIVVDRSKVETVDSVDIWKKEDASHVDVLMDLRYSEQVTKTKEVVVPERENDQSNRLFRS